MLIDWVKLFFAFIWILSSAIWLLGVSVQFYRARIDQVKWNTYFQSISWQKFQLLCFTLFCLGYAGVTSELWLKLIWVFLLCTFLVQCILLLKQKND